MKKTKKIISLLLSVLMIITALPLTAVNSFAADVVKSGTTGECTWILDGTVLTISGNGKMGDYNGSENRPWGTSITKAVIENGVTIIGSYAFWNCTSLTSVTIPDSVTSIGYDAFRDCTSLTSVTIPDSVTSIGRDAFSDCASLTSITIPDSVTSIEDGAFNNCKSLASITIPDGVTSIGDSAFWDCISLTSITIPDSVTSIGSNAFSGCTSLASITIPDSVTSIGSNAFSYTAYYNNESNWDNGILYIGNHLIKAKRDISGSVEIKQGTKIIADFAFSYCKSLTSITIPDSVTSIGDSTFYDCTSLTSVTIPDSVTSIENYAFADCTSLTSITIPDSVTSIGDGDFGGTAYYNDKSNWDNGILYIGNHLIKAKRDISGSAVIKQGTKIIADFAFSYCKSLTSITIPDSVIRIGKYAFSGCTSLTNITIPNSVTSIGIWAFADCVSFTSIIIPNSVTSISGGAFYGCASLISITIPDSVKSIGNSTFSDCTSLTSITIPDSTTSIGNSAFSGCTSLMKINVSSENKNFSSENGALFNKEKTIIIACPGGKKEYVIPDGVTSIENDAFADCTSLTNVTIPDSVTSIGVSAFYKCTSLTNITIPDSVIRIGHLAFWGCTSLTSVTIGENVKSIGIDAFFNCLSLKSIKLSDTTTEIGDKAYGYYYDSREEEDKTIHGFTVYGNQGSEAERYAKKNRFKFVAIGAAPTMSFPDVRSGDWYSDAVKYNFERGYITGYSNGTFGPANNIQRQDFVLILARIAGADLSAYEGQNGGFSDVQAGTYYASAVAWAKDKGVVNGYSSDYFGVGTYISREQICLIFSRYLGGEATGDVDAIVQAYPDGGNTSPWAKAGVAWAIENGIVGNAGYINPTGNAGRAEVAQIIYNMSNKGMI